MFLQSAVDLEDIIIYGMNPVVELLNRFEDEVLDDMEPDSQAFIIWIMLTGTMLRMREESKRIYQADVARRRKDPEKMELPLIDSDV